MTRGLDLHIPLSRRQLAGTGLALGSAAFLAACGPAETDPGKTSRTDAALLEEIYTPLSAVLAGYSLVAYRRAAGEQGQAFHDQVAATLKEVSLALVGLKEAGGTKSSDSSEGGLSPADRENLLIATTIDAVADLDATELRQLAYRIGSESAARLAISIQGMGDAKGTGDDPMPGSFVLGATL